MAMKAPTILIVEDSANLSDSLNDMLELKGYRTLAASTGEEGVRLALTEHPDLMLLDIRLPDINGYEVFNRVRQDTWGATAEVLVLTASESTETIAANISLPTNRILFKPEWGLAGLLGKISEIVPPPVATS